MFDGFEGYNSKRGDSRPRQWSQAEGSTVWQVNSEYDTGDAPQTETVLNPTVIYLILDCSTSLTGANVVEIRNSAKEFLDILYRGGAAAPKTAAEPPRTPALTSKPAAEPAPKPAPTLSAGFTMGDRIAAAALNTAFGLGSMIIMQDFVGGGIEAAGYAVGIGLIAWELMMTYEDDRAFIGIPGAIGLGTLGASFVWGVIRPFIYNRPASSVAGVFAKIHIDLVSDRQGKPALN